MDEKQIVEMLRERVEEYRHRAAKLRREATRAIDRADVWDAAAIRTDSDADAIERTSGADDVAEREAS